MGKFESCTGQGGTTPKLQLDSNSSKFCGISFHKSQARKTFFIRNIGGEQIAWGIYKCPKKLAIPISLHNNIYNSII